MNRFYFLLASTLLLFTIANGTPAAAQTLQTREVVDSLDTPWEILWGPDNWIWMTERGGRVSRVNPTTGENVTVFTVPNVYEESESGLLGMALHPGFADTASVYLVYNYRESTQIRERLVRYTYNGSTLVNPTTLIDGIPGNTTHDGSRLMITPDRILYMTTGDAQIPSAPQSHTSLNGKILRMRLDGSAPADNPFPNAPAPYNLIWTTGHRNPQGLVRAHNGIIYNSEHGPSDNDEINIFTRRGNFGWPNIHGPCDTQAEMQFCQDSSVIEPIKWWSPTLATAGLDAYNNPAIPEWSNSLLLVTLKENDLRMLKLSADGLTITGETIYFNGQFGRLRDLCVSPDGRVFIATSNRDGRGTPRADDDKIIEIKAATAAAPSIVSIVAAPGAHQGGERFNVTVATEGAFEPANTFTIRLSDSNGSFEPTVMGGVEYPYLIGGFAGTTGATTEVRLPCTVPTGSRYRIRVTSSQPLDTSINAIDIPITALELPVIGASGPATICEGDSLILTAPEGYRSYSWNNGSTSRSIVVREARSYSVEVVHQNDCVLRSLPFAVTTLPRPNPSIVVNGSELTTADEYVSYQWLRNGQPIPGATGRTYRATINGSYSVIVASVVGCSGISDAVDVTNAAVGESESIGGAISIRPQPVRDHAIVTLDLQRGGRLAMVMRDVRGAIVSRLEEEADAGLYQREVSMKGLPVGTYLITITLADRSWQTIFVKE
jgi:glucose/arabinose dehydrogenase